MHEIVVGVSGINAVDNPGPGVAVARSLREDADLGARVVGLAYDAMEPGIYLDDLIDRAFMMPYPSSSPEAYLDRLAYVQERTGMQVLVPNLDAELPLLIKYRDRVEAMGIRMMLPTADQFRLRGKDRLREVATRIGIDLPETRVVSSHDELVTAVNDIGLPVMVKGSFYRAYRAYTVQEAVGHFSRIVAEWGYPVIVQQVVTGEELNVIALGDGQGGSLGMVGIKKLMLTSLGKIWTGVTIRHEAMLEAATAFMREFRWRGPFELECIVDGETVYLVEINPRLPAWVYFATGVGVNLPARMVRHLMEMPLGATPDYDAGRLFVRYTHELVTDMAPYQRMLTRGER
jgi:carbamoyl-phosphate synthase large subunit